MHRFASVAVVDAHGMVLLRGRDQDAAGLGRWGLPGGDLEPGEDFRSAASRGLRREAGIRVEPEALTPLGGDRFHREDRRGNAEYELFAVHLPHPEDEVTRRGGRQLRFVPGSDVHDLDLLDAARLQLPEVLDSPGYLERHGGSRSRRFAGVLLVDRAGALLLQERDEHPVIDPEKWGLAGGHVEDGETFLAAAVRELHEETGVALTAEDLTLHGEYRVDHRDAYGSFDRMRVYAAASALGDGDIECHEGRRIVFVDPDVARGLDLTAAAAEVVPGFLRSDLYASLR